jgi:hypothetical protein
VVAVCRGENADYARRLGAADVIDYTAGDVVEAVLEPATRTASTRSPTRMATGTSSPGWPSTFGREDA